MITDREFFEALNLPTNPHFKGKPEPLHETVAVLSFEVGKMLEQAMYMHWQGYDYARMGYLKSELMDAVAQIILICQSVGVEWEVMREMGIEKAMERFTGKEKK